MKRKSIALENEFRYQWIVLAIIITITGVSFNLTFENGFSPLDDDGYLAFIRHTLGTLSFNSLFRTLYTPIAGKIQPFPLFSLIVDYVRGDGEPRAFHGTSLAIHLFNCICVFFLSKKLSGSFRVAAITALVWGIYPTQVEPVAGMFGRGDLVYGAAGLLTMLLYVTYIRSEENKERLLALSMTFFVIALFSKGLAVVILVQLGLLHFLFQKELSKKIIITGTVLLVLCCIIGCAAIWGQQTLDATNVVAQELGKESFSPLEKLLLSCYALLQYFVKGGIPYYLSAWYLTPMKISNGYPILMYASPFIVAGFAIGIGWSIKKYYHHLVIRNTTFGLLFFLAGIALVAQKILPIGGIFMADRYTYWGYIGLFYAEAIMLDAYWKNSKGAMKAFTQLCFAGYVSFLVVMTHERVKVWHDKESVRNDIVKDNRNLTSRNYFLWTEQYIDEEKPDSAQFYWKKITEMHGSNALFYLDKAKAFAHLGNLDSALIYINEALHDDADMPMAYLVRGNIYHLMGKYRLAINDFAKCLDLNPTLEIAYVNLSRSYFEEGMVDSSLINTNKALELDSTLVGAYIQRSRIEESRGDTVATRRDSEKAERMRKLLLRNGVVHP